MSAHFEYYQYVIKAVGSMGNKAIHGVSVLKAVRV
jgi:hypothetical protein